MQIFKHKIAGVYLGLKRSNDQVGTFFLLDRNFNKTPSLKKNGFQEVDQNLNLYFETRICRMENVEPYNEQMDN